MGDNEYIEEPARKPVKCPVCNQMATLKRSIDEEPRLVVAEEFEVLPETVEGHHEPPEYKLMEFDPRINYYQCPNDHDFYISEYTHVIKPEPKPEGD